MNDSYVFPLSMPLEKRSIQVQDVAEVGSPIKDWHISAGGANSNPEGLTDSFCLVYEFVWHNILSSYIINN
jgi:hypothetical protein